MYPRRVNWQLNSRQEEARSAPHLPLLITAGAGSGKTRTLTSRLAYFLEQGVPPEQIIALTFTNKAADEMRNRLRSLLKKTSRPFIGTFHSLGSRILREEASGLDRQKNFSIFDDADSEKVVKNVLKELSLKDKPPLGLARHWIGRMKNELLDPAAGEEKINLIFQAYEQALARQNAFDFDDLIEKPVRLFQDHPKILEKYRDRFGYILVDEYQDINTSQYVLIKLLAEKHRRLSVVGDDQQSIYGFRGSDFRNFLNFEKDWPEAKTITLDQNYRSSGNIVSAAGAVIGRNTLQRPKTLWTENPSGEQISISGFNYPDEEAGRVSEQILGLNELTNTAILYRTNAQSRPLEQTLIYLDIPYEIFGGLRFYDRYEIKDAIAALRLGLNPQDEVSRQRLETNFRQAVSRQLLADLPRLAETCSPLELIGYFLKTADYQNFLRNKFPNAEEREENLAELVSFAEDFSSLEEFLEKISLFQSSDSLRRKKTGPGLRLMTIHLAKGLEFDNVFLVGANEGTLPHQKSLLRKEELEEERRLMYVAMTRARKRLFISFYGPASRFLYEIPPELIQFCGQVLKEEDEIYLD